jgi:hypothetical protein
MASSKTENKKSQSSIDSTFNNELHNSTTATVDNMAENNESKSAIDSSFNNELHDSTTATVDKTAENCESQGSIDSTFNDALHDSTTATVDLSGQGRPIYKLERGRPTKIGKISPNDLSPPWTPNSNSPFYDPGMQVPMLHAVLPAIFPAGSGSRFLPPIRLLPPG